MIAKARELAKEFLLRFGRVAEDELEFERASAERAASWPDPSVRVAEEASHA